MSAFSSVVRAHLQRIEQTQSLVEVAAQKLTFRLLETELIGEIMLLLPLVVAEKPDPRVEIVQWGSVSRRGFRSFTCHQIQFGELDLLLPGRH